MTKLDRYIKWIICASSLLMISLVSAFTTMYGDDFLYATYFSDGFSSFWAKTCEHYLNTNGRAFVHLILEILLIFKDALFVIALPLMLISIFLSFKLLFKSEALNQRKTEAFSLFLIGIMCLSVNILSESVFWISGALNYIFPVIFALLGFILHKKILMNNKFKLYFAPLLFICGATTEQCGVIVIFSCVFYTLFDAIKAKKVNLKGILSIAFLTLGFLSIILSPSTMGRMENETLTLRLIFSRFDTLFADVFGAGSICRVLFLTFTLYLINQKSKAVKAIGFSTCIFCVCFVYFKLFSLAGYTMSIIWTILLIYTFIKGKEPEEAILLLAALLSLAMLIMSLSYGLRNFMPCVIIMLLMSAYYLIKMSKKHITYILLSAFLIGCINFYPTLKGYFDNSKIINENIESIKNASDEIYYNLDLNQACSHRQLNSFYFDALKKVYGKDENTKIYFTGKDFNDLILNGKKCEKPIFKEKYYPMRHVIGAYGGSITYNADYEAYEINVNDKCIFFESETKIFLVGNNYIDGSKFVLTDDLYGNFFEENNYLSKEAFLVLFGIKL